MADSRTRWDTSYEWRAVTLLGLGFGLVGLDRWIRLMLPCIPFISVFSVVELFNIVQ